MGLTKNLLERIAQIAAASDSSDNWCAEACQDVSVYLLSIGIVHRHASSESHSWLELRDGTIIDPTISQFGHNTIVVPNDHPLASAWFYRGNVMRWDAQ